MTDAPDSILVFAEDWKPRKNFIVIGDTEYLRATPARIHAEELLGALREIVALNSREKALESYQAKNIARATLARIERKKP